MTRKGVVCSSCIIMVLLIMFGMTGCIWTTGIRNEQQPQTETNKYFFPNATEDEVATTSVSIAPFDKIESDIKKATESTALDNHFSEEQDGTEEQGNIKNEGAEKTTDITEKITEGQTNNTDTESEDANDNQGQNLTTETNPTVGESEWGSESEDD